MLLEENILKLRLCEVSRSPLFNYSLDPLSIRRDVLRGIGACFAAKMLNYEFDVLMTSTEVPGECVDASKKRQPKKGDRVIIALELLRGNEEVEHLIKAAKDLGCKVVAVIVGLDEMEVFKKNFGVTLDVIADMIDVYVHFKGRREGDMLVAYLTRHGVSEFEREVRHREDLLSCREKLLVEDRREKTDVPSGSTSPSEPLEQSGRRS